MIKKALLFYSTTLLFFTSSNALSYEDKIATQLELEVTQFLSSEQYSSISVGVVHGEKTYTKHAGELYLDKNNPPNDDTLYEIGSVSKTMVGLLTAYALHDGKLALNQNIDGYIPDDLSNVSPRTNPITVKQLLSHTSGLPKDITDLGLSIDQLNKTVFLQKVNQYNTSLNKGKFVYSSVGAELMSYLLEVVYQKPFDSLLQSSLNRMANMKTTQVGIGQQLTGLALGYNKNFKLVEAVSDDRILWGGSGFIKSSMADLIKYMRLQVEPENLIVKTSHQMLFEVSQSDALAFFWIRSSDENLGTYYIHHGGLMGTQNWMMVFPTHELAISLITNSGAPSAAGHLRQIGMNIAALVINKNT